MKTHKLAIIGVGHVGTQVLASALHSHLFSEIILIDPRTELATGEALDQAHATGLLSRHNTKIYVGQYSDLIDVDICIIAASYVYPNGELPEDRQALLTQNAYIIREIMTNITQVTHEPILLFITNPADTVVYMAATEFDYPKNKVIGTGCSLDSARLRYILAQMYDVAPHSVQAYMLGEHGYTAFPALSLASIAGIGYQQLKQYFPNITEHNPDEIKEKVVLAAYDVFRAKNGVTDAAIAQVAIDITQSILLDDHMIYPVSTVVEANEYHSEAIAYSLPTIIGKEGIVKVLPIALNEWEQAKLKESLISIQTNIDLAKRI